MITLTNEQKAVVKKVFEQMIFDIDVFRGCYDAKNGNEHFMFGIATPLTYLAYTIDEEYGEQFDSMFMKNVTKSIEEANK